MPGLVHLLPFSVVVEKLKRLLFSVFVPDMV
jgi:hypothetical protein